MRRNFYNEALSYYEENIKDKLELDNWGFLIQCEESWNDLLHYLSGRKIKNVIEIGSLNGGSLWCFSRISDNDANIFSIDLDEKGQFVSIEDKKYAFKNFEIENQKIEIVNIDSKKDECLKILKEKLNNNVDILFIDGSHNYEDVKNDFNKYSKLVDEKSGVIIFHDIFNNHIDCVGAKIFWNEIKNNYYYEEFINGRLYGETRRLGIGLIDFSKSKDDKKIKKVLIINHLLFGDTIVASISILSAKVNFPYLQIDYAGSLYYLWLIQEIECCNNTYDINDKKIYDEDFLKEYDEVITWKWEEISKKSLYYPDMFLLKEHIYNDIKCNLDELNYEWDLKSWNRDNRLKDFNRLFDIVHENFYSFKLKIGISFFSSSEERTISVESQKEIAYMLLEKGYLVINFSDKFLNIDNKNFIDIQKKINLEDSIFILSKLDILFTVDTGFLHASAICRTKFHAFFDSNPSHFRKPKEVLKYITESKWENFSFSEYDVISNNIQNIKKEIENICYTL